MASDSTPPKDSVSRRKAHSQLADEASFLPSNDRNEWYYPIARHRDDYANNYDDEDDDGQVASGAGLGNWGNKLSKGSRWIRRGKIVAWGPAKYEWDIEDRARKRLRRVLPTSRSRSRSPQTLTHLRSQTPPLTASYSPTVSVHRDLSSFVLDPAVQHSFTSTNLSELEGTATELIAGEAALRKAFGGLWRALEGDLTRREVDHTRLDDDGDDPEDDEDDEESGRGGRHTEIPPLHKLFITPSPIPLTGTESRTVLPPQSQLESLEWALGVLRELADDGREYTSRLEEIRDGLGRARAVRAAVWRESRAEALGEMRVDGI